MYCICCVHLQIFQSKSILRCNLLTKIEFYLEIFRSTRTNSSAYMIFFPTIFLSSVQGVRNAPHNCPHEHQSIFLQPIKYLT